MTSKEYAQTPQEHVHNPFRRVLLVKPSGRHGLSFAFDIIPTGLEYIAAYIEDVVEEVNIIDLEMESKPVRQTAEGFFDKLKPDLVGISMSATEHTEGLEIAKWAKERGAMTVLGGYHPTAIPDELLSHPQVDFIVRGEGEKTMRELILQGSAVGVKGVSYRDGNKIVHNPEREFIDNLDDLPFPARHLRRHRYHLTLQRDREHDVLTTSRGCWGRCNFCCEPSMSGSHQRYRSPENVLAEILEIVKFHGGKPLSIEITDPHFMGKPPLVERLCDLLAPHKLDINFCAKVRPDSVAKHPDIIKKMISVGIASYEMGIESPSIKDIKNTSKGLDTNVHTKAVESIKKWGGSPGGTFVVGLPDHTEEEILQFPLYAKKLGLTSSAYGVVTPFPGTKFYEELDSQGVIFEKDWNRFDEMHSVFKMKNISSPRIEELASICMAKFWTIDTFIEQERVRTLRTGTTTPLKKFLADRLYNLKFGVGSGAQLQEGNFRIHAQKFIEASPDPSIREYTERVGMHNVIEMTSFLKLLGTQTVQITVKKGEAPLASWVFKTTRHAVEYVDVIPGKIEDSTINFDVDLESFKMDGTKASRSENIRIMLKIMKSNKGLKRQFNLMRLLIASGFEMIR